MFKETRLTVDESRWTRTDCRECKTKILKNDLRVKIQICYHYEYYHLLCYRPRIYQFISKDHVRIHLKQTERKIFDNWLDNWNSQFHTIEEIGTKHIKLKKSLANLAITPTKPWVLVLKYLKAIDIINCISILNKETYEATWNEDLWDYLFIRDYNVGRISSNPKVNYLSYYLQSCLVCKKLPVTRYFNLCPIINRFVCSDCYKSQKFLLLNKKYIHTMYGIRPDTLGLEFGVGNRYQKVTYKYCVEKAVYKHRLKMKAKIVTKLIQILGENHYFVDIINNINLLEIKKHDEITLKLLRDHSDKKIIETYLQISSSIMVGHAKRSFKHLINNVKSNISTDQSISL